MPAQPRTCIGCRSRDDRQNLVRLVCQDSAVMVDEGARRPGRGAWIHPSDSCLARALRTRALDRAFRTRGVDDSALEHVRAIPADGTAPSR